MTKKAQHLHERLGITFPELGALLGTRELLKQQALVHHEASAIPWWMVLSRTPGAHLFNMNITCRTHQCGTVGCIGGTMAVLMGKDEADARQYVAYAVGVLGSLFYPTSGPFDNPVTRAQRYDNITSAQAVRAINNFLAGKEPWAGIKVPGSKSKKVKPAK